MIGRQLPARDYFALKAATRALLKRGGGQRCAADCTRVGQQALSRYGDADETAAFAPIDVIADLEADLGDAPVTRALADLAGFDLVPRAQGDGLPLLQRLPRLAKESSDVVSGVAQALADGVVTDSERAALTAETHQAIAELHRLLAALNAGEGQ